LDIVPRFETNLEKRSFYLRKIIARCTVNALDALHISTSCFGEASFFVTCDDEILQRKKRIEELAAQEGYRLKVRDPTNYLEEKGEVEI